MMDEDLDYLMGAPPGCLGSVRPVLKEVGTLGHVRFIKYAVICAACGRTRFTPRSIRSDWGEETSEIGIAVICGGCEHRAVLFDATMHGYDGEFGNLNMLRGELSDASMDFSKSTDGTAAIIIDFVYNISVEELLEHAQEVKRTPQDFFDAISFCAAPSVDGPFEQFWEYECA